MRVHHGQRRALFPHTLRSSLSRHKPMGTLTCCFPFLFGAVRYRESQLSAYLLITVLLPYCHCKITLPLNVISEFLEAAAQATKTALLESPFLSFPVQWRLSEITSLWCPPSFGPEDWRPRSLCQSRCLLSLLLSCNFASLLWRGWSGRLQEQPRVLCCLHICCCTIHMTTTKNIFEAEK